MLPLPLINFFPKLFQNDSKAQHLAAVLESYIRTWSGDTLELRRMSRPDEMPSAFLDELNYYLQADFIPGDTDAIKRQKLVNAISSHKLRTTFLYDMKLRIDAVTGLDSRLVGVMDAYSTGHNDDWIMFGDGISEIDYKGSMGVDNIDLNYGLLLVGAGTEIEIPGNIYIDCHHGISGSTLTPTEIADIVTNITKIVPAYMTVSLCYYAVSGIITVYPNGTILI